MCQHARLALAPTREAAREARQLAAHACDETGVDEVRDAATLVLSELVTNVVLHAKTALEVDVYVADAFVELAVTDRDPQVPVLRPPRTDPLRDIDAVPPEAAAPTIEERHPSLVVGNSGSVAAGRGLLIVDALSDEWGVIERSDGKTVWAVLCVTPGTHANCACGQATSVTASGRPCVD